MSNTETKRSNGWCNLSNQDVVVIIALVAGLTAISVAYLFFDHRQQQSQLAFERERYLLLSRCDRENYYRPDEKHDCSNSKLEVTGPQGTIPTPHDSSNRPKIENKPKQGA